MWQTLGHVKDLKQKKSILVRAFLENPLFKLFPALILNVGDPGTC
jgi:hypothetical protein